MSFDNHHPNRKDHHKPLPGYAETASEKLFNAHLGATGREGKNK